MTSFLQDLASFIADQWSYDFFGKVIACLLTLLVLAVAVGIVLAVLGLIGWIFGQIEWYRNRRRCTHCTEWTTVASDGTYGECPQGQACCSHCTFGHLMDHEPKLSCLVCGTTMDKKSIKDELVADVCPNNHGTWLGTGELDIVEQLAYDHGYSNGKSDGTATGIAIGSAM